VAAEITPLMPGAGPPPTSSARVGGAESAMPGPCPTPIARTRLGGSDYNESMRPAR
jgi:hypothetical protein